MRRRQGWALLAALALGVSAAAAAESATAVIDLSGPWRFGPDTERRGLETGWAQPDWADSGWPRINAGASWEEQGLTGYDGLGWYRRTVTIPQDWANERVHLIVTGADDVLTVYLNGEPVEFEGTSVQPDDPGLVLDVTRFAEAGKELCMALSVEDLGGPGGLRGEVLLTTLPQLGVTATPMQKSSRTIELLSEGKAPQARMPEDPLPESGLTLTRRGDFGKLFSVSSRKAALFGYEGHQREVWLFPFKATARMSLSFLGREGGPIAAAEALARYDVRPESATFTYRLPQGTITETLFAPETAQGVVGLYRAELAEPVDVVLAYDPMFLPMWPANVLLSRPTRVACDQARGAYLFTVNERRFSSCVGAQPAAPPSDATFEKRAGLGDGFYTRVSLGPDSPQGVTVIAGGPGYSNAALRAYDALIADPAGAYLDTAEHWSGFLAETTQLVCPDETLGQGYDWARVGLAKHVFESPIGTGYVAGLGYSWEGGRPGFCWYFGRDSSWEAAAGNALGLWDDSRSNVELEARYQTPDGKCYHEISLSHNEVGGGGYCYNAGDSTPFFVLDVWDLYLWSGDRSVVTEHWENVVRAVEWCYANDVDGDLLIDNPPAGHQWFDYGCRNMIDLVAIWARALDAAAHMAKLMEMDGLAQQWSADHLVVLTALREEFWNEERGYFYDRKTELDTMLDLPTCNPAFPLGWGLVEPDKAARALTYMAGHAMTADWGLRTTATDQDIYNPEGYHEGSVWPFVTGAATLAAYRNGRGWLGYGYLYANARLAPEDVLGGFNEVIHGDVYRFIGQPYQGWSNSMIVQGVLGGLWGVRVGAAEKRITVSPQLPADWRHAGLRGLRAGDTTFDIDIGQTEGSMTAAITGGAGWTVTVSPVLPAGTALTAAAINGETAQPDIRSESDYVQPALTFETDGCATLALRFARGPQLLPLTLAPEPEEESKGPRLVEMRAGAERVEIHIDARAGTEGAFRIYLPRQPSRCRGAELTYEGGGIHRATVHLPQGEADDWTRHVVEIEL